MEDDELALICCLAASHTNNGVSEVDVDRLIFPLSYDVDSITTDESCCSTEPLVVARDMDEASDTLSFAGEDGRGESLLFICSLSTELRFALTNAPIHSLISSSVSA